MIVAHKLTSPFTVTPLPFGVRVDDLRLSDIDAETGKQLLGLAYRHKLLVIGQQTLTADQYVDFARKIARPQVYLQKNYHHPDHPEIFVSANGPVDGKKMGVARTGYFWHSDCSFEPTPLSFTMIYPQILPSGERSTHYLDMEDAYARLPPETKERIRNLHALHDGHSRYKIAQTDVGRPLHEVLDFLVEHCPFGIHPMVARHPVTGKDILYINSGFTSRILGVSVYESWAMLTQLFAHAEDIKMARSYEWREGDVAIWDNRSLLHRSGTVPTGEVSAMFRIGLYDDLPVWANSNGATTSDLRRIYPCF